MNMHLESAQRGTASTGKNHQIRHLQGERLTRGQAIHAKCFDCMGGYADGRTDCQMPNCALYPFMRFRGPIPNEDALEFSSTPGKVAVDESLAA
jgi:hypothetical protein